MGKEEASVFWQGSEVDLQAPWSLSQTQINGKPLTSGESTENLLAVWQFPDRAAESSKINRRSKRLKNKALWVRTLVLFFLLFFFMEGNRSSSLFRVFQASSRLVLTPLQSSNFQNYLSPIGYHIFFSHKVTTKARTVPLTHDLHNSINCLRKENSKGGMARHIIGKVYLTIRHP